MVRQTRKQRKLTFKKFKSILGKVLLGLGIGITAFGLSVVAQRKLYKIYRRYGSSRSLNAGNIQEFRRTMAQASGRTQQAAEATRAFFHELKVTHDGTRERQKHRDKIRHGMALDSASMRARAKAHRARHSKVMSEYADRWEKFDARMQAHREELLAFKARSDASRASHEEKMRAHFAHFS